MPLKNDTLNQEVKIFWEAFERPYKKTYLDTKIIYDF